MRERLFVPRARGLTVRLLSFGALLAWVSAVALGALPAFGQTSLPLGLRTSLAPAIPAAGLDNPISTGSDTTPAPAPAVSGAPNYRKPVPRTDPATAYAGRAKPPAHPLPGLVPYPGAPKSLRDRPIEALSPSYAAPAVPPRKNPPKTEADPFGPIGIGVGSLRLFPYVEVDGGYDSNPDRVLTPSRGSATVRTEAGLTAASDWSRDSLTADLRAGYTDYLQDHLASRPDAVGKIDGRFDVSRDLALDGELRGALDTQRPGSPEVNAAVRSRPLITSFGATAGGTETLGRLSLGLHALADRTLYEDGTLTSGTILPLSSSNFTSYGVVARVAYEVTPGFAPFVELGIDTRRHDQAVDSAGYARDSRGASAKIGSTFEFTRTLTGQIAGGYAERRYDDARLPRLGGPTIDSSLIWAATPLTTVTLAATTTLDETNVAGASGALDRKISLVVAHALLRNLTLTATGALQDVRYRGVSLDEKTVSGTLAANYALSRSLVLRASVQREHLRSTTPGGDYTANVFLLGLRLQR